MGECTKGDGGGCMGGEGEEEEEEGEVVMGVYSSHVV